MRGAGQAVKQVRAQLAGGDGCHRLAREPDDEQAVFAIAELRGEGLLLGVELVTDHDTRAPAAAPARAVADAMRDRGILLGTTGPAGNVLKIRPPLVFGREHADLLLHTLDDVLSGTA